MEADKEKQYKRVSKGITINSLIKGANKGNRDIMIQGSRQIFTGVEKFLSEIDRGNKKLTWMTSGLKKLARGMHNLVSRHCQSEYQKDNVMLTTIERGLKDEQQALEEYFKQKGVDVSTEYAFSSENQQLLSEIFDYLNANITEVKHIQSHKMLQYMLAYIIVQRLARKYDWEIPLLADPPNIAERKQEANRLCIYAAAIYGKQVFWRYCLDEKRYQDIFKGKGDLEMFMLFSQVSEDEVVFSFLESKPFT